MTANSPRSVAESASSTIDPDALARRANDGELSAGFHSDLTIDEDAVDGLLTADDFAAAFDENRDDGTLYAEYRRLVAEQAALRRLATLVVRGVEPMQVFGAVADQKGIFEKNGLDVDLKYFADYIASLDAMTAGKLDANTQTLNDTMAAVTGGSKQAIQGAPPRNTVDTSVSPDPLIAR